MNKSSPVADPSVSEAAHWLAGLAPEDKPHPVIPELRRRFALTAADACHAIAEANYQRAAAYAASRENPE